MDAGHLDRLADQDSIEPAAAALAPGDGSELAPALTEIFAPFVLLLGRERAFPDPRGISLGDAEHIADGARPDAGPGRRLPGHGVGGGHERIGAVVDIEERALRSLEEDARSGPPALVEKRPYTVHE